MRALRAAKLKALWIITYRLRARPRITVAKCNGGHAVTGETAVDPARSQATDLRWAAGRPLRTMRLRLIDGCVVPNAEFVIYRDAMSVPVSEVSTVMWTDTQRVRSDCRYPRNGICASSYCANASSRSTTRQSSHPNLITMCKEGTPP